MESSPQRLFWRVILGVAFGSLAFWLFKKGWDEEKTGLLALALLPAFISGGFFVKPIGIILTAPLFAFVDSVVFPKTRSNKPTLNLKLPRHYCRQSRYLEALEEYEIILKHYPDEIEAYAGAIWIHREVLNDENAAAALAQRARKRHLILEPFVLEA
ncbi:MAG: hypothetical protein AAF236_04435 [Verrucomicrobiota bacterium]